MVHEEIDVGPDGRGSAVEAGETATLDARVLTSIGLGESMYIRELVRSGNDARSTYVHPCPYGREIGR